MNSLRRTTSTAIICCTRHGPTCYVGLDSESRRPRTIVGRSNWPRTKANGGIWSEGSDKCRHRGRKGFAAGKLAKSPPACDKQLLGVARTPPGVAPRPASALQKRDSPVERAARQPCRDLVVRPEWERRVRTPK